MTVNQVSYSALWKTKNQRPYLFLQCPDTIGRPLYGEDADNAPISDKLCQLLLPASDMSHNTIASDRVTDKIPVSCTSTEPPILHAHYSR